MKKIVFALIVLFISTASVSAQNFWGEFFNAVNTVTQEVIKTQQQQYNTDNNTTTTETNTTTSSSYSSDNSSSQNNGQKHCDPCYICHGTTVCTDCSGTGYQVGSCSGQISQCYSCSGTKTCRYCGGTGIGAIYYR